MPETAVQSIVKDMQTNLTELLANLGMSSTHLGKNVLGPFVFLFFSSFVKVSLEETLWLRTCFLVNNDFQPLGSIMKAFLLTNNFVCCSHLYFAYFDVICKIKAVQEFSQNKFKNIMN